MERTFGFHPLAAIDTERREVLFHQIRPGNAGSNTAEDHIEVLNAAIEALPEPDRAGHNPGDDPTQVVTELVVRADTGGRKHWFIDECRDRNIKIHRRLPDR